MSTERHASAPHHVNVLGEIKADLRSLLDRLDELGFYQAGAHLSMSIQCLDPAPTGPFRVRESVGRLNGHHLLLAIPAAGRIDNENAKPSEPDPLGDSGWMMTTSSH